MIFRLIVCFALVVSCLPRVTAADQEQPTKEVSVVANGLVGVLVGTREGSSEELSKLQAATSAFKNRTTSDDFSAIETFVQNEKGNPWRLSLMRDLGRQYYSTGYFSKALATFEEIWEAGHDLTEPKIKAIVDDSFGELVNLHSRLGHFERLDELKKESSKRTFTGSSDTKVLNGWESLAIMKSSPDIAFRCGPLALGRLLALKSENASSPKEIDPRVMNFKSTSEGTSLEQVYEKSNEVGGGFQMARRTPGAQVIVPALVHWKAGHFAAVTATHGDGQYVVRDSTFADVFVVSSKALDEEASGYFLIPEGPLPTGWAAVSEEVGSTVWGKGVPTGCNDKKKCPEGGCVPCAGMAVYSVSLLTIGLNIYDMPIWYESGFGPGLKFKVSYTQRDAYQEPTRPYSNLGPLWTHNIFGYVKYDSTSPHWPATARVYNSGGGVSEYTFPTVPGGLPPGTFQAADSNRDPDDGSILRYIPDNSTGTTTTAKFERTFADGSKLIYEATDGSTSATAYTYASKEQSREGPAITYQWLTSGGNLLLQTITDATGKKFTFSHQNLSFPTRITKVEDDFGRSSTFEYNSTGHLIRITDMGGLTSEFEYSLDQIVAMITPYGRTSFDFGTQGSAIDRWLEVTDPAGAKERFEFRSTTDGINSDAVGTPAAVPGIGFYPNTSYIRHRNTFYWNKKAMMEAPGDYTKAQIYHWLHNASYGTEPIVESEKKPLETRVFYSYPGQAYGSEYSVFQGTHPWPITKAQLVKNESGSWVSKIERFEYDAIGNLTKMTDPFGRVVLSEYDSSGQNLTTIQVQNGGDQDTVWHADYYGNGMPTEITNASGEGTSITWHPIFKKPATVANAKGEVTTYSYGSDVGTNNYGRLIGISGALPDAPFVFDYDAKGRLSTHIDGSSYTKILVYDNLNRLTQSTSPIGIEKWTYSRLDLESYRDRSGGLSRYFYNSSRKLTLEIDPLKRKTTYDWCDCGSLHGLIDARGNGTSFKYDLQQRVTEKQYADGSKTTFSYQDYGTSLASVTDAKGQTKSYKYFIDGRLAGVAYSGSITPNVSFAYDSAYPRLVSMIDGTGTTSYIYHPVSASGQLGANQLATVDGPMTDDAITYSYDELGRLIDQSVNGVSESYSFDAKQRVSQSINPLGTFTYGYEADTSRMASISYPSASKLGAAFTYYNPAGGLRLQDIVYSLVGSGTQSSFQYAYDTNSNIVQWKQLQGVGASMVRWDLGYDNVDQLLGGALKDDASNSLIEQHSFKYDPASNRITNQIDSNVSTSSFNNLNQLTSTVGGGKMVFEGAVSEPAQVAVGGSPAKVDSSNVFQAEVDVSVGSNSVPIVAMDGSGNSQTKNASFVVPATSGASYSYDLNGNMTGDGVRTFEWDVENRLVAINYGGSERTEFTYDGLSRRVRIKELSSGVPTSDRRLLWSDLNILEDRATDGIAVNKRYFDHGFQEVGSGRKLYYVKDHLGSIRSLVDDLGVERGRWVYDLYGKQSSNLVTVNPINSDIGYTGHHYHPRSQLWLAPYRAYNSKMGRWISRDPMESITGDIPEIIEGPNLYEYVANNVVNRFDPDGLQDKFRPDYDGHQPAGSDPHIDRLDRRTHENKGRYNPDGTPRDGAPKIDPCEEKAFNKALKELAALIASKGMRRILGVLFPSPYEGFYGEGGGGA